MNTVSASRVEAPPAEAAAAPARVLVWDVPVRVFHWLMALSFAGAWITAESERWRLVHVTLGYTLAGLVVFRLAWGIAGTRYARFGSFVRGPGAVLRYLRSLLGPRPEHHVGHNPAGGWAILALLAIPAAIVASGWAIYNDVGGEWLEDLHEAAATLMLGVAVVHVAGVVVSSWLHRENLVRSMVTGTKVGTPADGVRRAWHTVGALMIAAVLGFWYVQWQGAPAAGGAAAAQSQADARAAARAHDDDD